MPKKNSHRDVLAAMQKNIHPLDMNGLSGRMLRIKSAKKKYAKREILVLYGHHASLERMYGIAEVLADYGNVTMPDFPGCGGMDSFYKIGMKPSLDTMADYLASFVKLNYRGKKVSIAGMSLGFAIVTRMLQRYPELVKKVDVLVSLVGFTHKYDYAFASSRQKFYIAGARFFSKKLPSMFYYNVFLHPLVIKTAYSKTHNAKKKLAHLDKDGVAAALEFEVDLWRGDDPRTYMRMAEEMLTIDNCQKQIKLPVHHVQVKDDQYFDNEVVEQHMRVVFTDFTAYEAVLPNHAPSIVATKKEAKGLLPKKLKKLLEELS